MEPRKPERVTFAEMARRLGVGRSAITRAVKAGRLVAFDDGTLDPAVAAVQWESNRRRRRAASRPADGQEPPPEAAGFWESRARREAAEAALAELKLAETRRVLVRAAEVERELAGRLIALREHLETMADRLAAVVAAESDQSTCRRLIAAEVRQALRAFVAELEPAKVAG